MAKKARGYTVNGVRKALAVNVGGIMKIAAHDDCCCGFCFDSGCPQYFLVSFYNIQNCVGQTLCTGLNGHSIMVEYLGYDYEKCLWRGEDGNLRAEVYYYYGTGNRSVNGHIITPFKQCFYSGIIEDWDCADDKFDIDNIQDCVGNHGQNGTADVEVV